jgi:hypothetical protein
MTQKSRKYIVCFLILLFFIVTPPTILYSQGYRFDITNRKISSTGGLFIKALPKSANIYLDEILVDKTDFLFGSVLVENLLPKQYKISLKKDGYYDWNKTLEIKEKQVADAKNITLVPENPKFSISAENVENFYFFPNQKKMIIQEKEYNSNNSTTTNWSLKLFDIDKNIKSHLISDKKLLGYKATNEPMYLLDINFSPDANLILAKTETKIKTKTKINEQIQYYIIDLEKRNVKSQELDFTEQTIENIWFSPKNSEKIFYFANNKLFKKNILKTTNAEMEPVLQNIIACDISGNNIYYIDTNGSFIKTNLSFQIKEKLLKENFRVDPSKKYRLEIQQNSVFLFENKILYWLNTRDKGFEKLLDSAEGIELSPDAKKICYFNNYEIWILSLENQMEQPKRKAGEKVFLTRFSKKIRDISWWTNHYLIFTTEEINSAPFEDKRRAPFEDKRRGIKIIEIDNRDKTNSYILTESQEPNILWDYSNKKLYVLNNEILYCSEKLIK